MAAALFNRLADPSKARALSAGTNPGTRVHPEVVAAMRELGVDLAGGRPQRLTEELAAGAALLVTMGCGEACPVVPGVARDDWPLEDPKGKPIERVREIRNELEARVQELMLAEAWSPWTIRDARAEDRAGVEALLQAAKLPIQGVAEHVASFVVADAASRELTGAAGLELYGTSALLRSLVVDADSNRRGLGSLLTRRALAKARSSGATEVFLLTETAQAFFERRGFQRVARSAVAPAVTASSEFNGACPDSATVLRRQL